MTLFFLSLFKQTFWIYGRLKSSDVWHCIIYDFVDKRAFCWILGSYSCLHINLWNRSYELPLIETCYLPKRLVNLLLIWFIYIKLYYLSSFKLYMYMYTLGTAEINVDTHECVTEARIVKVRVWSKDANKLINWQWRRNAWQ